MTQTERPGGRNPQPSGSVAANQAEAEVPLWKRMLSRGTRPAQQPASPGSSVDGDDASKGKPEKWSMGVLNDRQTDEVPGTYAMLLSALPVAQKYQEIRCGLRAISWLAVG